jgi:Cu+-exporting ATPase
VTQALELYELELETSRQPALPIDPVCRMAVEPSRAAHRELYGGKEYYFCSNTCRTRFLADPEPFVRS